MLFFKLLLDFVLIYTPIYQENGTSNIKYLEKDTKLADFVLQAELECEKEVPNGNGTNFLCVEACKFKKYGVLVDESKPKFDMNRFDEIIRTFPNEARNGLLTEGKKCFENVEPLNNDDNCKTHGGYINCFLAVYAKQFTM